MQRSFSLFFAFLNIHKPIFKKLVIIMSIKSFSVDILKTLIPKEITTNFSVKELISLNQHSAVFCLISNSSDKKYVIKILDKSYYDKKLYQQIFCLKNSFLLLPEQCFSYNSYYYFLYPHMTTLTDVLSTKRFTYPMLRNLICNIGEAITTLHNNKILHLDITPNNIFMNSEGHFFLGDFSSSQFTKMLPISIFNHAMRTGTTPPFAPDAIDKNIPPCFWNDCYSFSVLLYLLSNDGNFPSKEKEAYINPFDALHSFLDKKMKQNTSNNPHLIKDFLSDMEHILELCDKDTECQNYYLQINEEQKNILSESTINCAVKHISTTDKWKSFLHILQSQYHSPIPIYGLFIVCGFIFLFSLYHYLSQNKLKLENRNTIPIEYFADTSPAAQAMPSAEIVTSIPLQTSSAATIISPSPPVDTIANSTPFSLQNTQKLLNLSDTNCKNPAFSNLLADNSSLQILFANHCQLTTCTSFSDLTKLEELYLHNNKIKSIQGLDSLTNLKVLVLSKNKLCNITKLSKLATLTTLDLSHNQQLQNIASLAILKKLQFLILTNTNITKKEVLLLQKKLPHCTIFY